jgi:hypothetical protein
LLKNIQKFIEKFNIIEQPHHKLWYTDNFEFSSNKKFIDIVILNEMQVKEKTKRIKDIQDLLLSDLNDSTMEDNDIDSDIEINNNSISSEEDVPKENNRKKRKKKEENLKKI